MKNYINNMIIPEWSPKNIKIKVNENDDTEQGTSDDDEILLNQYKIRL